MKKNLIICIASCALCVTLLGCTASHGAIGNNIEMKMNDLTKTMNSIMALDASDISFAKKESVNATPVAAYNAYNTPYYSNVNTYGYPSFGGYGMYPMNSYYGFNGGYGNMFGMPYNPYNANPMFSNPNYNNIGANNYNGNYYSNVDTYRINSINKDGKIVTTIDSYHNGEPVDSQTMENEIDENDNQEQTDTAAETNLSNSCTNCLISNSYSNQLKEDINNNIDYVKKLSSAIKSKDISLSKNQVKNVNELLDNIIRTQNKINMTKSELNEQVNNVQQNIENYDATNPNNLNTKYIKLLSCMDTRNSYLQSILNSLLQMENCIDGSCQNGNCWNGSCTNGNFLFPSNSECSNCNNCPNCLTCNDCKTCDTCNGCESCNSCNNCYFCNNCENCTDCFNCENCRDCSNLANAKNCVGNCLTKTDNTSSTNETTNNNSNNNTNTTEQVNVSSDDTVRDHLLDNNDVNPDEPAELLSNPQTLPTEYDENKQHNHLEETYDNSIFNQNQHENNKGLTA